MLDALSASLPVPDGAVRAGLQQVRLAGRLHVRPGAVEWLFDVAHNADAVGVLAAEVELRPAAGRCHAVFGIMARKDLEPVLDAMRGQVDAWWPLVLPDQDARPAGDIAQELRRRGEHVVAVGDPQALHGQLQATVQAGDRVLVFGSFRTVEEMMHVTGMVPA